MTSLGIFYRIVYSATKNYFYLENSCLKHCVVRTLELFLCWYLYCSLKLLTLAKLLYKTLKLFQHLPFKKAVTLHFRFTYGFTHILQGLFKSALSLNCAMSIPTSLQIDFIFLIREHLFYVRHELIKNK